jgi:hypothetical protein
VERSAVFPLDLCSAENISKKGPLNRRSLHYAALRSR